MCTIIFIQQMKELARRVSPDIKQIDLDVHRTFRDHVMFRERYNIKLVKVWLHVIFLNVI